MSILICGGAGYIGSHTVRLLQDKGEDVIVLDDLRTGYKASVDPSVPFFEAAIDDRKTLATIFEKYQIEAVIDFAASSQVGESMVKPLAYYQNNLSGTSVLVEMMIEHHVPFMVFSSTAAVYGMPDETPIVESMELMPVNPYGDTKLAVEKMLFWCAQAHPFNYVALRYFNAAGAHPSAEMGEAHQPESHLIPLVIQAALGQRDSISVFGEDYPTRDGTCIRDYIHVCDLAQAHLDALNYLRKEKISNVFNLGTQNGASVREVIDGVRRKAGHDFTVKFCDRRAGDPAVLVASSQKASDTLNWKPTMSDLNKIIETAWNWHYSHPEGWS